MEVKLTVVELDLVKSSKSSSVIHEELGVKGTDLLYSDIKNFVNNAFNSLEKHSTYDKIIPLGGDGYRISFNDVNNAYKFVQKFSEKVKLHNAKTDRKKRIFRISAVTGDVSYDISESGVDLIKGDILRILNRLNKAAKPGWIYIDKNTYQDLIRDDGYAPAGFEKLDVKINGETIPAYACQVISDISISTEQLSSTICEDEALSKEEINKLINDIYGLLENRYTSDIIKLANAIEMEVDKIPSSSDKPIDAANDVVTWARRNNKLSILKITIQNIFPGNR